MSFINFSEWLSLRKEGFFLPDRPPLKGMSRINPFPCTDVERKRLHVKKIKPPKLFPPTIRKVAEIVPQQSIRRFKPFSEYVRLREGLWLNDKKAMPGLSKLAPPPMTPKKSKPPAGSSKPIV